MRLGRWPIPLLADPRVFPGNARSSTDVTLLVTQVPRLPNWRCAVALSASSEGHLTVQARTRRKALPPGRQAAKNGRAGDSDADGVALTLSRPGAGLAGSDADPATARRLTIIDATLAHFVQRPLHSQRRPHLTRPAIHLHSGRARIARRRNPVRPCRTEPWRSQS